MFDSKRWIASTIFLGSIALTIGAAVGLKSVPLSIIAVIIQFLALGWYCLSYIPYGRCVAHARFLVRLLTLANSRLPFLSARSMVTKCCKSATSDMI